MVNLGDRFEYRDGGALFLWALLAMQAVSLVFSFLPETLTSDLFFTGVLNNLVLLAVYGVYSYGRRIHPVRACGGSKKFSPWLIPTAILAAPLCQVALVGSMTLFDRALAAGGYESVNGLVGMTFLEHGVGGLVGYVIVSGLLTGFCEELLFRGGLLPALRDRCGDAASVLISAACFAVFHCSPDQTIYQFGFGAVLGYLTVRAGSVVPAMILHAANNILTILMTAFEVSWYIPDAIGSVVAVALIGIVLGSALISFFIDFAAKTTAQNPFARLFGRGNAYEAMIESPAESVDGEEAERIRTGRKMGTICLAVGAAICAAIWIAQLVSGFVAEGV